MPEFDDRHEVTRRARETLARLQEADRKRAIEKWQRVDDLDSAVPVVDYRGCRTTTEMTSRQFAAWCDAGKPALENPVATHDRVLASKVDALVRIAVDRERTNTQASLEAFAAILGEECALIENKMRSDFEAKLDLVRAEINKNGAHGTHLQRGGDDVFDLPNWRSDHVEH